MNKPKTNKTVTGKTVIVADCAILVPVYYAGQWRWMVDRIEGDTWENGKSVFVADRADKIDGLILPDEEDDDEYNDDFLVLQGRVLQDETPDQV